MLYSLQVDDEVWSPVHPEDVFEELAGVTEDCPVSPDLSGVTAGQSAFTAGQSAVTAGQSGVTAGQSDVCEVVVT